MSLSCLCCHRGSALSQHRLHVLSADSPFLLGLPQRLRQSPHSREALRVDCGLPLALTRRAARPGVKFVPRVRGPRLPSSVCWPPRARGRLAPPW